MLLAPHAPAAAGDAQHRPLRLGGGGDPGPAGGVGPVPAARDRVPRPPDLDPRRPAGPDHRLHLPRPQVAPPGPARGRADPGLGRAVRRRAAHLPGRRRAGWRRSSASWPPCSAFGATRSTPWSPGGTGPSPSTRWATWIRVDRIEQDLVGLPGLDVAGAALRGVGIPACIGSGRDAARRVLASLDGRSAGDRGQAGDARIRAMTTPPPAPLPPSLADDRPDAPRWRPSRVSDDPPPGPGGDAAPRRGGRSPPWPPGWAWPSPSLPGAAGRWPFPPPACSGGAWAGCAPGPGCGPAGWPGWAASCPG